MKDQAGGNNTIASFNNYLTSPYLLPDYFTRAECEGVIAAGEGLAEFSGSAGEVAPSNEHRKSTVRFIAPTDDSAWIYKKLQEAVLQANKFYKFDLKGIRERLQVAEYGDKGHYTWHVDVGKNEASTRKLSISVQLSGDDEYEGGDLEFHSLGNLNAPKSIGSAIIFPSYLLHRVTPVTSGTRRSLVLWVHGQPYR